MTNWLVRLWRRWVKLRRERRILKQCGCICWCPRCKEPLNDQADVYESWDYVQYVCRCGLWSKWDFGPPVPILISMDVIESPKREGAPAS